MEMSEMCREAIDQSEKDAIEFLKKTTNNFETIEPHLRDHLIKSMRATFEAGFIKGVLWSNTRQQEKIDALIKNRRK